jgi:hypothetical protein
LTGIGGYRIRKAVSINFKTVLDSGKPEGKEAISDFEGD